MNTADQPSPTATDQEELVAYLDGELTAEEGRRVEQRLAEDAAYRQLLRQLQGSWDLLDDLPCTEVDDTFTQSTVEMVAMSTAAEASRAEQAVRRRRVGLGLAGVVAAVAAAAASFAAVGFWLDRPNQQFVRDLPVIENLELYKVAESVEFLRELDQAGLFNGEADDEGM